MTRTIYCVFLKKYSVGLDSFYFPGELGKRIYDNISKEAWKQWQDQQTILINENKLNMLYAKDRLFLIQKMKEFLFTKS
ncbi:putative Fe(2+)-trafficking protein [Candidatus Blochmanniella vafra str. BVAF]|uniref:Fe(2+)-trafficking protein n=1 Tax=Blochmanniella vafra (strain BVAF) TaxID=859654 RepID=E8Q631_BLOVB|nr:oxidative damage protection protein [Candidatus Blochmannia vafer]ADV33647.1 putative Fe(2+)-trafficking protein [Candidatus Blochmannia vafer str. BVAF]